ncbi:uncharacterized protein LOC123704296 isoform X1 [Colias croceus]|uniref:uncharacterized protein LOC123701001 n=1 Tax=Colias crocea TaxID=72248 RepID=UPI001E2803B2|nr:uncharacterized protein LOC123701001 [Colias croceus]XP_045508566.1 uncharacterized protein LOC123704296 isoform X1 [Colias croceus]
MNLNHSDLGQPPTSEVGSDPHSNIGTGISSQQQSQPISSDMEAFLRVMRGLVNGGVQNQTTLMKYDPDDPEADIESWCRINEVLVKHKDTKGTDLLLSLTQALRGRAATCLAKMNPDCITWENVKEHLIARFSKPLLMQDYFERVITFKMNDKETAADACMRLWHLIESIPDATMNNEVITGFCIAILSRLDNNIKKELNSNNINNKTELCRALRGVSLKRQVDDANTATENKRPRYITNRNASFVGYCHRCGEQGHKSFNCNKFQSSQTLKPRSEEKRLVTCYSCGLPGHVANACPAKNSSLVTTKEVKLCGKRAVTGELQVADE